MQRDLDALKFDHPLDEVAMGYLGQPERVERGGNVLWWHCPLHGERTASFQVDMIRRSGAGSWKCFGCDRQGDVFDLVAELEGISVGDAIARLAGDEPAPTPIRAARPQPVPAPPLSDAQEVYGRLSPELPPSARAWLESRGIHPWAAIVARVRWEPERSRLALPCIAGEHVYQIQFRALIGIKEAKDQGGRAVDNLPGNLYGALDGLFGLLPAPHEVYLVEAPFDCLSLISRGYQAVSVFGGSGLGKRGVEELRGRVVTLIADNDDAGREHRALWRKRLGGVAESVRDLYLPPEWLGHPISDINDLLRAAPNGLDFLIDRKVPA